MALLVKEQKALTQLEQAFKNYYVILLGEDPEDLGIDPTKTPEERMFYFASWLNTIY